MEFVATLMETATADRDALRSLDRNGNHVSMSRDVDFLLLAPDAEKLFSSRPLPTITVMARPSFKTLRPFSSLSTCPSSNR
jgi:hypothetical protein